MRQIEILPPYEAKQFDCPPIFNYEERKSFFILPSELLSIIASSNELNRIGIVLQYGYFKATGKFYRSEKYQKDDVHHIAKLLNIKFTKDFFLAYSNSTKNNHKRIVLNLLGYELFSKYKEVFKESVLQLVSKQMHPRKMLFALVDQLRIRKIEIPNYDTFARYITEEFNTFENTQLKKLNSILTESQLKALNQLTESDGTSYRRPMLIDLKNINQSVEPGKIKDSLRGLLIIKKLHQELSSAIATLGLSSEAMSYYGIWIIKAKVTQINEMVEDPKRHLYLLSFIEHQFKVWQDTLIEVLLKCVKAKLNLIEKSVNQLNNDNLPKKNKLTKSVLKGYEKTTIAVSRVRNVVYDSLLSSDIKVDKVKEIVSENQSVEEENQGQDALELKQKITDEQQNMCFFNILLKLSTKLQNRVADIIKYLDFIVHDSEADLGEALKYYQSNKITKASPAAFLNELEYNIVYANGVFNVSMYKAIFYVKIYKAIKSGAISLIKSYKCMPIELYLIEEKEWDAQKDKLLERAGLLEFKDIEKVFIKLRSLDKRFYEVNARIKNKENKYVVTRSDGGITAYTPAIEKPEYESIAKLIGNETYVPILQMMSDTNAAAKFTNNFTHYKIKGSKAIPQNEILFAGIFALGSNIGMHKLASTAIGINYNTLINAVKWYFSLGNLYAVNNAITDYMNRLWLPNQFKKEKALLHTSSDGQKRCVSAESLNANYSYKYFGHGKGSNIYTFIDERGILFYSTVFSSSERDAAYVIDGLLHNAQFKSDMHSTDTHGYSEIVFAVSYIMNISFAPRIKDISSVSLVSFSQIIGDLENKEYSVLPNHYINTDLITNNWDSILRLITTIKLREHRASTIIKRLSSYTRQHPLLSAIKEFGKIIKSSFILEYIDSVELRQVIEKQLNKGELANKFSSAVSFANNQEIMQVDQENQEIAIMCKTIIQNIIILWNYLELTKLIIRSDNDEKKSIMSNILSASILTWRHVNLLGTYDFSNLIYHNDNEISHADILNYQAS
jgi:TnpA family transposase